MAVCAMWVYLHLHFRIGDIVHADDPVDNGKGGGNDGTDKMRHKCCSSKSSLRFDALLLRFAGIGLFVLLRPLDPSAPWARIRSRVLGQLYLRTELQTDFKSVIQTDLQTDLQVQEPPFQIISACR